MMWLCLRIVVDVMPILNWHMMAGLKKPWKFIQAGAVLNGWCKTLFGLAIALGLSPIRMGIRDAPEPAIRAPRCLAQLAG